MLCLAWFGLVWFVFCVVLIDWWCVLVVCWFGVRLFRFVLCCGVVVLICYVWFVCEPFVLLLFGVVYVVVVCAYCFFGVACLWCVYVAV